MSGQEPIPPHGGRGGAWWDQSAERRLDFITSRLTEIAGSLGEVTKELRSQIRTTDIQGSALQRLDERLKDVERALEQLPSRLERLASNDWMQRLDARLNGLEDENRSPFVRKTEFGPVRMSMFALIATVCAAVVGAVLKLVMK